MRHATVNAIHAILGNLYFYSMEQEATEARPCAIVHDGCWFRACDWSELPPGGGYTLFTASAGGRLRGARTGIDVVLPDCPRCAVLVDLALEVARPVHRAETWTGSQWVPDTGWLHLLSDDHSNWLRAL